MAALGDVLSLSGALVREVSPVSEQKQILVELPATVDATDTFTLDLTKYGCTRLSGILGFDHTTDGSVVTTVAPTTSVTTSTVTVTVGAGGDNRTRVFVLWCR